MADDQIVNEELTSTEETVSPETEKESQEQPFTDAQKSAIQQLMADQSGLAKEAGRREMQGIKDREIADAQRRARSAEDSLGRVRGRYENLDPEARQALEMEDLRADNLVLRQREQQGVIESQRVVEEQALVQALLEHLSDMGIDPKDTRIDWAQEATTRSEGLKKFNKSVSLIVKEDASKNTKKAEQDAKDKLAQERKEAGLDSTDAGVTGGVDSSSDTKFMEKFGAGEIPMTKANVDRANRISNQD